MECPKDKFVELSRAYYGRLVHRNFAVPKNPDEPKVMFPIFPTCSYPWDWEECITFRRMTRKEAYEINEKNNHYWAYKFHI